jgi:NADH-quinone oxidoreductase chain G
MSIPLIPITINNRPFQVRANASVLQACEEASFDIPRFCYHEKLSVAGSCRMCLVEVQKSPKPVVSCAMPVSKGMVIYTDTPLVKKAREAVLEFLLINHPLDCPICDQGGECDLQDETLNYGSDRGRFFEYKRSVEDKECGPIVKTIMTRCIHCTRCVRFSAEIAGNETMGAFGRGQETEIGTYVQSFIKTELSGNLVDLCPVGALTSKPYAFVARSWELQKAETVDFFDGVCSDILVHTRQLTLPQFNEGKAKVISKEEIVRILPRTNGLYEENWISDKTRYAFDGLRSQRALTSLSMDRNGTSKNLNLLEVLLRLSNKIEKNVYATFETTAVKKILPDRVAAILGSQTDLESIYVLSHFIKFYGGNDIQQGNFMYFSNLDAPFYFGLNRSINSLHELNNLIMIGTNPRFEASLVNTMLRKHQNRRALSYATVGAFTSLKLKHSHVGNSVQSLLDLAQNKKNVATLNYVSKSPSIIFGFESLKMKNSLFVQNIIRLLGKKYFVKTKKGERLGALHSNITTLNLANLGFNSGVRSSLYTNNTTDKKISTLFTVQLNDLKHKKWLSSEKYTHIISFSTNKNNDMLYDTLIPIKSLYEKDSLVYNVEGRLRSLKKVVTAPSAARSVEAFLIALNRTQQNWYDVLNKVFSFEDEIPTQNLIEKNVTPFYFNFLNFKEPEEKGINSFFKPTVINFYMTDIISNNSSTMGECSLFLNKEYNFVNEM